MTNEDNDIDPIAEDAETHSNIKQELTISEDMDYDTKRVNFAAEQNRETVR